MTTPWPTAALIGALFAIPSFGFVELRPETVQAWDQYIRSVDARTESRVNGEHPFLWVDEAEGRRARVHNGEVLVSPMVGHGTKPVSEGLIHDWVGAAFFPQATLERLIQVFSDYDRFREYYRPFVVKSQLLSCSSDESDFAMTWQHSVLFVVAAMEARFRTRYFMLDPHRGYSVGQATNVLEIANYGHGNERLLPAGAGHGYLWRLHTVTRYEQRDAGVYLEVEVAALTRPVPDSLHWLVNPVLSRLSVNSLTTMLRQTRDALSNHSDRPPSACARSHIAYVSTGPQTPR